MVAPLDIRSRVGASVSAIAEEICARWHHIDTSLSPVVGRRGVVALFERTMYLAAVEHPWLLAQPVPALATLDVGILRTALLAQDAATAAAAGYALLQTFHNLLIGMIGASLTERLLGTNWSTLSSGPSARDPSP